MRLVLVNKNTVFFRNYGTRAVIISFQDCAVLRPCNSFENFESYHIYSCGPGSSVGTYRMFGYYALPLTYGPPKRRRAILWILASFVAYRLQRRQMLTCQDYYEFIRRAKWKLQQTTRWHESVGNYLRVLDEVPPPGMHIPDQTICAGMLRNHLMCTQNTNMALPIPTE